MKHFQYFLLFLLISQSLIAQKKKYFFKNSKVVQSYGALVDGKKNGEWIFYFPNGYIKAKGSYVLDLAEGKWLIARGEDYNYMRELYFTKGKEIVGNSIKAYYSSGELRASSGLKNNQFHGTYKEYYKDGTLGVSLNYMEGNKNGPGYNYYANGKIKAKVSYKNNQPFGLFEEYWENGNLKTKVSFNANGKNGVEHQYWQDGKKALITTYKEGKKEGLYERYTTKGLYQQGQHSKGLKVGEWLSFDYDNNKIYTNYDNYGKKSGPYKKIYPSGEIAETGTYVDDKKDKVWKIFYKDGKLMRSQTYKYGKKNGSYVVYSNKPGENYFKRTSGYFYDGQESGNWYTYTSSGSYEKIVKYEKGKSMKSWQPIYLDVENKRNKKIVLYLSYKDSKNVNGDQTITLYPGEKKYVGMVMNNDLYYYYKEGSTIWYSKKDMGGPRVIMRRKHPNFKGEIRMFKVGRASYLTGFKDKYTLTVK